MLEDNNSAIYLVI